MPDLWAPAGDDPRDYHPARGERDTVLTYLRNYRLAFERKLEGLDAEQLAPPGRPAVHAVAAGPDLDFDGAVAEEDWSRLVPVHGEDTEVRDIAVHLVEEYARHVGHADLLRECLDGRTGQ